MKATNSKIIWYWVLLILGIALNIATLFIEDVNEFWSGLGIAIILLSALRLIQFGRMKKDVNYAKKVSLNSQDERNVFISMKARANTFSYSIVFECLIILVLYIIDKSAIAEIIGLVVCGQLIIYYITYFQLNKKY